MDIAAVDSRPHLARVAEPEHLTAVAADQVAKDTQLVCSVVFGRAPGFSGGFAVAKRRRIRRLEALVGPDTQVPDN
jgi:hypothetical protein